MVWFVQKNKTIRNMLYTTAASLMGFGFCTLRLPLAIMFICLAINSAPDDYNGDVVIPCAIVGMYIF